MFSAAVWLYAYSLPAASLVAQLIAGVASVVTAVAALGWAADARNRRGTLWREAAVPGGTAVRASAVALAVVVVTCASCAVRAPMWARLAEALPQMLYLAHRAGPPSLSGAPSPAWAGTYHFGDVSRRPPGYVVFESDVSGLLQSAAYVYSPGGDPRSLEVKAGGTGEGVHYRHLVGPWWAETSDVPGT